MLNAQNTFGFLGCNVIKNDILTYGYDGSIYYWKFINETKKYQLNYLTSGHINSVKVVKMFLYIL